MVEDHTHECQNKERIINIEKEVTEVKTQITHYHEELQELKNALKENTEALNNFALQLSEKNGSGQAYKWILATFGLTIFTIVATRLFNG